jgi:hypothetical protein
LFRRIWKSVGFGILIKPNLAEMLEITRSIDRTPVILGLPLPCGRGGGVSSPPIMARWEDKGGWGEETEGERGKREETAAKQKKKEESGGILLYDVPLYHRNPGFLESGFLRTLVILRTRFRRNRNLLFAKFANLHIVNSNTTPTPRAHVQMV